MKRINIITGHYGCGKTNISVNFSLKAAAQGRKVTVVDFDLVNPYFRTADFSKLFKEKNIKLVSPDFACSNLDIPSVQFDLTELAYESDCLIIDVGGDDAGAFALGRYSEGLGRFSDELEMYYVINQRRNLTSNAYEAAAVMYEIEAASRMKHTAVINNTNLGALTSTDIINRSSAFARELCEITGLPLALTTYPEGIAEPFDCQNTVPVQIYVKPPWEISDFKGGVEIG